MDEESIIQRVLHFRQVEHLTQRQIAQAVGIGRGRVGRILKGADLAKPIPKKSVLDEYIHLIVHWYKQHPRLKATQIYERLKEYGYQGSYPLVVLFSREYRRPKENVYHPLVFFAGRRGSD